MHRATKYNLFTEKVLASLNHLNKSDLALANVTVGVSDGYLAIVLNPSLSTDNVMNAGSHLIPLIVVSKSGKREKNNMQSSFI